MTASEAPHEDIMTILFKLQIPVHPNQRGENTGPYKTSVAIAKANKQLRNVMRGDVTATIQLGTW